MPRLSPLLLLLLAAALPLHTLAAPGGLRLTQFATTCFSPGDFANGSSVSFTPAPVALSNTFASYVSARLEGTLTAPISGNYSVFLLTEGGVRLWVDDHLVINDMWEEGILIRNASSMFPAILIQGRPTPIKIEYQHNTGASMLGLLWAPNAGPAANSVYIPSSALSSDVRPCEDSRHALIDRLGVRNPVQWGTHWIDDASAHVHLASRLAIPFTLADVSQLDFLWGGARVFGHNDPARVRYGPHSINGSDYTLLNISDWKGRACDVTIESTVVRGGVDLLVLISAHGADCAKLSILIEPMFMWNAAGVFTSPAPGRIDAWRPGFVNISLFAAQATSAPFPLAGPTSMTTSLASSNGPNGTTVIGFSTGRNHTLSEITAAVVTARAIQSVTYSRRYGDALAEVGEGIESIIVWNTVFSAIVGPYSPVSRSWDWGVDKTLLFDWDIYLLALQATGGGCAPGPLRDIAYANLLTITLSRTWTPAGENGFVPNFDDFEAFSSDRTEPQIGALVLKLILERCGSGLNDPDTAWLVDYLFEPLLGWHNWVWDRRRGEGVLAAMSAGGDGEFAPLMVLGSEPHPVPVSDSGAGTIAGARDESGQDNGPEYDGVDGAPGIGPGPCTYNITTGHMNLYSVQITSHFLADAEALAQIANATGRGSVVPGILSRFNASFSALNEHLWEEGAGVYTNKLFNGSFYPRRSPTLFYPMMSGAASDAQVETMMEMLVSPAGFCVTNTHRGPLNTSLGVHYFSAKTNGSIFCGTDACMHSAVDRGEFYWRRVETLPWSSISTPGPGSLTLSQWYDSQSGLFAVITGIDTPPAPGYVFVREEGFCAPTQSDGLVPLDLWYGPTSPVNSTAPWSWTLCATPFCAADAKSAGGMFNRTLCYAPNATGWENMPCKYGVPPSIARSDPAWNNEADSYNYWRGRIWGPHVALVYFGLQRYDHVPAARAARATLVAESRELFLRDWRAFRHVNENTNSITGSGSDNGSADPSYHWGALTGFISLLDAGY